MATKSSMLRDQLLTLLQESTTSVEEDVRALSECLAQVKNRRILEEIVGACGLTLAGSLANDSLELYYDVKRGRHSMGYIAKGWADPGFRIGDVIEIDSWEAEAFHSHLAELLKFCAVRGIAMTATKARTGTEVHMDGVIYSAGFNAETFQQTIESLNECVDKVETLIRGSVRHRVAFPGRIRGTLARPSRRSH